MSRSGYMDECDDNWALIRWRGQVASATKGRRGQRLLIELRDALDGMEVKSLISGDLVTKDGECCPLGAVLLARGEQDAHTIDPEGSNDFLAKKFDIAECLVAEIEYENDEYWIAETSENRWARMRIWVEKQIEGCGTVKDIGEDDE